MLFDDAAPGDPSGDLLVGEVACLDQEVAHYEVVQRGRQCGSHDGVGGKMSGNLRLGGLSREFHVCKKQLT